MNIEIKYKGKEIGIMKSYMKPNYGNKTILTDSNWEYVGMYLKRQKKELGIPALFYWEQAKHFYEATIQLPISSKPLTTYYCFLNATKALLISKGIDENKLRSHGVSGYHTEGSIFITNEMIKFKNGGVLPELERYLGEDTTACEKNLKDIFYNLPFIHRAYCLTNVAQQNVELFIPIQNPIFVKKQGSREAWFQCELEEKYANKHTFKKLPDKFEVDKGRKDKCIIRYKDKFKWGTHDSESYRIQQLTQYHKKVRKKIYHIYSHNKLWYIKRKGIDTAIDKSTMTLCFVAMHRLSELSRYQPRRLQAHLNSQNSWLVTEFVEKSLQQFIDEISSEITGDDFRVTGFRT